VNYLQWLSRETPTRWWHDSGHTGELRRGLDFGATGVTTNPILTAQALQSQPEAWADAVRAVPPEDTGEERAPALIEAVAGHAATQLLDVFERTEGRDGYACAQVNPAFAGDREAMRSMAQRFHESAPNIAVKLPATAAGLDVAEDCMAEGIAVTITVSFTVPQLVAIAERYRKGLRRAIEAGVSPRPCFAVLMVGRLDDYLREQAADQGAPVSESDIRQAGLAVGKHAYEIYRERGYEATLLYAAFRHADHICGMAGADDLVLSIHPKPQALLLEPALPRDYGIDHPVPADVIERLKTLPDFVTAYDPDGMSPADFIRYGLTQRTLSSFLEGGWKHLESITS
jgi:transaldolase